MKLIGHLSCKVQRSKRKKEKEVSGQLSTSATLLNQACSSMVIDSKCLSRVKYMEGTVLVEGLLASTHQIV